jgi:Cof subfamily protein (haloacid dehalogenase superfamily)
VVHGEVRLVASDLDGTLLAPGAVVSERTADVLRAVADRGVEVVAVTGRSHWSSVEILEAVGCIRWMICSNGATVYDAAAGAVVHDRPLGEGLLAEVVERLSKAFPTLGWAWETPEGIFHTEEWIRNRRATNPGFATGTSRPADASDLGAAPVRKLMVTHDRLTTYEWLGAVEPHLPSGVHAATSGAMFVEVTRTDANKGDALAELCRDLGVDRERTVAFGDHANDLTMLAWAGVSFAMANAAPQVQAVADHLAPDHAEDGVAQVLERLLS